MPINLQKFAASASLPLFLASCFFEASGCSGNICVSTGNETCTSDDCDHELICENHDAIEQRMASIISSARREARQCGQIHFDKARAVFWNAKLASAALRHSNDMASKNFLSHTGSDGRTIALRINDVGYDYRVIAENIAGGQQTSSVVVNDWLNSSGHCSNIMNPQFREIGAACVRDSNSDYETYWTLVLAAANTPD